MVWEVMGRLGWIMTSDERGVETVNDKLNGRMSFWRSKHNFQLLNFQSLQKYAGPFSLSIIIHSSKSYRARLCVLLLSSPRIAAHRRASCHCCSRAFCVCVLFCTRPCAFSSRRFIWYCLLQKYVRVLQAHGFSFPVGRRLALQVKHVGWGIEGGRGWCS